MSVLKDLLRSSSYYLFIQCICHPSQHKMTQGSLQQAHEINHWGLQWLSAKISDIAYIVPDFINVVHMKS